MSLERDTRPLGPEELSPGQIETIGRLNALLAEIQEENQRVGDDWALGGEPYSTLLPQRSHRVLLLDGIRGTGKTSLLLTLLRFWRPDGARMSPVYRRGGASGQAVAAGAAGWHSLVHALADRSADEQRTLKELFNHSKLTGHIVPLSGVDLDPKPSTMGIHALLLQGFAPLVASMTHQGRRAIRRDAEWEQWGAEPEDEAPDLAALYRHVQRDAIAAEGTVEAVVDDIDLAVTQRVAKDRSWIGLRARYWDFVEALLTQMGDKAHQKLLIVSLDDLDLNPQHADDVLQAMRMLWHPQVVFLATGDYEGLVGGVHLSRLKAQQDVARLSEPDINQRTQAERCLDLAKRVVEKTLPWSRVIKVPLGPSLGDLLRFATGSSDLFAIVNDPNFLPPDDGWADRRALHLLLRRWAKAGWNYNQPEMRELVSQKCGLSFREFETFKTAQTRDLSDRINTTARARVVLYKWASRLVTREQGTSPSKPRFVLTGNPVDPMDRPGRIVGCNGNSGVSASIPHRRGGLDEVRWAIDLPFYTDASDALFGSWSRGNNLDQISTTLAFYLVASREFSHAVIQPGSLAWRNFSQDDITRRIAWPALPSVSLVFIERYLGAAHGLVSAPEGAPPSLFDKFYGPTSDATGVLTVVIFLLAADRFGLNVHTGHLTDDGHYFNITPEYPFGTEPVSILHKSISTFSPADVGKPSALAHAIRVLMTSANTADADLRLWLMDGLPRLGHACYGLPGPSRTALLNAWRKSLSETRRWAIDIEMAWESVCRHLTNEGLTNLGGPDEEAQAFGKTLNNPESAAPLNPPPEVTPEPPTRRARSAKPRESRAKKPTNDE